MSTDDDRPWLTVPEVPPVEVQATMILTMADLARRIEEAIVPYIRDIEPPDA